MNLLTKISSSDLTIALLFSIFIIPSLVFSQTEKKPAATIIIPDSIFAILKNSCMDCHSKGGNMIAESHLNLSKWNEYSAKKQVSKAEDICSMLSKAAMPPKGARKSHPEKTPTLKQIDNICKWSNSLSQNNEGKKK